MFRVKQTKFKMNLDDAVAVLRNINQAQSSNKQVFFINDVNQLVERKFKSYLANQKDNDAFNSGSSKYHNNYQQANKRGPRNDPFYNSTNKNSSRGHSNNDKGNQVQHKRNN